MFTHDTAHREGCLLDVFSRNVGCRRRDAKTFGRGKGADWQRLTKACPAFAAEYAGAVLRKSGGSAGEFGPVRARAAEVITACEAMPSRVQDLVQATPAACTVLR